MAKKSHLKKPEIRVYKEQLLFVRARLRGDVSTMADAALKKNRSEAGGELSSMPIHMADVGSDVYDQDLRLGMAASERQRILEIDDALVRIAKKNYGICQSTGEPIPLPRLRAKPWAKYTKEAAERVVRMNRRP